MAECLLSRGTPWPCYYIANLGIWICTIYHEPQNTMQTNMSRVGSLLNFLNSSPSPHHVVENTKQALVKAGFVQLLESESWESSIKPAGKYFITRNGTSILALAVERDFVSMLFIQILRHCLGCSKGRLENYRCAYRQSLSKSTNRSLTTASLICVG